MLTPMAALIAPVVPDDKVVIVQVLEYHVWLTNCEVYGIAEGRFDLRLAGFFLRDVVLTSIPKGYGLLEV
jgi:hypothetical protein